MGRIFQRPDEALHLLATWAMYSYAILVILVVHCLNKKAPRSSESLDWAGHPSARALVAGSQGSGYELGGSGTFLPAPATAPAAASARVPDMFQLHVNFRTHAGITALADSVVAMLERFFPHSIDKLQPESSRIQGGQGLGL